MLLKRILTVSLFCIALSGQSQSIKGYYKIDQLLERINHPDTVYILNFWAVWCKPCIQELPSFDSLNAEFKGKPVKVLLVSVDFKEDAEKKVNVFLQKKKIRTDCVLLDEINGNDYIDRIDKKWSGAIPATFFKKGNSAFLVEKKLDLKELKKLLAPLLPG